MARNRRSPLPPSPPQVLAGFGLPDRVRDRPARHAEAARGGVAVAAQLPSWRRFLLRRLGSRPAATQGQLPEVPHRGGNDGLTISSSEPLKADLAL